MLFCFHRFCGDVAVADDAAAANAAAAAAAAAAADADALDIAWLRKATAAAAESVRRLS